MHPIVAALGFPKEAKEGQIAVPVMDTGHSLSPLSVCKLGHLGPLMAVAFALGSETVGIEEAAETANYVPLEA